MCMSLQRIELMMERKLFFSILGADFLAPKGGHRPEKQSVLGPDNFRGFSQTTRDSHNYFWVPLFITNQECRGKKVQNILQKIVSTGTKS